MSDLIDEIDKLAGKATERPWERDYNVIFSGKLMVASLRDGLNYGSDGAFIVALVNAFPKIAAQLRAAEKVCEAVSEPGQFGELAVRPRLLLSAWRKAKDGPSDEEKREDTE